MLAVLILALTLAAVSRGTAGYSFEGANHAQINFNLAPGATQVFGLLESNTPIVLSATTNTGSPGTGSVVITHHTTDAIQMTWTGVHANATIANGLGAAAGTDVVGIGEGNSPIVELHSVGGANSDSSRRLRVNNNTGVTTAGNVQMIW
jgi:hypothetical protein